MVISPSFFSLNKLNLQNMFVYKVEWYGACRSDVKGRWGKTSDLLLALLDEDADRNNDNDDNSNNNDDSLCTHYFLLLSRCFWLTYRSIFLRGPVIAVPRLICDEPLCFPPGG